MKKNTFIWGIIILIFIAIGCVPPEPNAESEKNDTSMIERNEECDLFMSFAGTNYQNQEWAQAIKNYQEVIDLGCSERNAEGIFQWMGRAYIEIGELDSAAISFRRGMQYLTNDIELRQVAAWNQGKIGNWEEQIILYEQILAFDDCNLDIIENISDVYFENASNDEQYKSHLTIIKHWLRCDQGNKKALSEQKRLYGLLDMEEWKVDCEQWHNEPSNIQYGLNCADGMRSSGKNTEVVDVLKDLLSYERRNKKVLKILADLYLDLQNDVEAKSTFEELYRIDPTDCESPIKISQIEIDQQEYKSALSWAEKAINCSGGSGNSYYNRAEVYYEIAADCDAEIEGLTFFEKVVFEFAFEDYDEALKKGYHKAKTRRDFLKENLITKSSDWFMRPDNEKEVSPKGDCSGWITRKLKRK